MENPITIAKEFATRKHLGQVRHWSKEPYITHPEAVRDIVYSMRPWGENYTQIYEVVAWLHDTLEDTQTSWDELRETFGPDVASAVLSLTRGKDETYLDFILRVAQNELALPVKLADIKHNLESLPNKDTPAVRGLRDRYTMALWILNRKAQDKANALS